MEHNRFDFLSHANQEYLDSLYETYRENGALLDPSWTAFFMGFDLGIDALTCEAIASGKMEARDLVHSYRELGHLIANLNPLETKKLVHPLLELSGFGFSEGDLDRQVGSGGFLGRTDGTLRDLLSKLKSTYCGTVGVEFMGISQKERRLWLQEKMETTLNQSSHSKEESIAHLKCLIHANEFERFLHTKYVGQKRFSLEGLEALIPLLEKLLEDGAALGGKEFILGMAHRGRLNVVANVLKKPFELILSEFEVTVPPQESEGDGDVKYHLGFSRDRKTLKGKDVHCALKSNPSHLELVYPVIEGIVRAKQQYRKDHERSKVVPILIHGEAAFTGQGVVSETLNLSQLEGYQTGGTVHIVLNNQLGFTASADQTRSTNYPTDIVKMVGAPIFHVNADDVEAVVHVAELAIAFRYEFKSDVAIDLLGYRRHGHNETDDATFTQPLMYDKIASHPSVLEIHKKKLVSEGKIGKEEMEALRQGFRKELETALGQARKVHTFAKVSAFGGVWKGYSRTGDWNTKTQVTRESLREITKSISQLPSGFTLHSKFERWFKARHEMAEGSVPIDWATAETWAIGSLLLEGIPVRLVGQDTERGTFSHRHMVLHDRKRGERFVPLANLKNNQASFTVLNTLLSELAVLAFEFGFSYADPRNLVLWEAQFGDFANGAQTVIDQFIAASESKWQRMSGLVCLLPHGYEGQGPEHSSARLERFLQLAAENNFQVAYPTLPSQYFHLLRRQMRRPFRKPLIVITPKSLLRHKASTSQIEDFTDRTFSFVLGDPEVVDPKGVNSLLLCSGKIYFTLAAEKRKRERHDILIVRIEELYPLPEPEITSVLEKYKNVKHIAWIQEEPKNMGAWSFIEPKLRKLLKARGELTYVGREEAASPATGSFVAHEAEERAILDQVFSNSSLLKTG